MIEREVERERHELQVLIAEGFTVEATPPPAILPPYCANQKKEREA